jgi:hypothetical protein
MTEDDKVRRLIDDFLAGLKPNTLRTYRQGLADFASFVGTADARQVAEMLLAGGPGEANHLALSYRANMVERDLSANTINNRLAALRSLVKLARTVGMIGWTIDVGSLGDLLSFSNGKLGQQTRHLKGEFDALRRFDSAGKGADLGFFTGRNDHRFDGANRVGLRGAAWRAAGQAEERHADDARGYCANGTAIRSLSGSHKWFSQDAFERPGVEAIENDAPVSPWQLPARIDALSGDRR